MDTKVLHAFLQVCRDGGIRKAARNLYISPQGLSKIIKELEKELGIMLFEREPNRFILTSYGKIVQAYAEEVTKQTIQLKYNIEKQRLECGEKLEVSCSYGVMGALSPDYFSEFRMQNPHIDLHIHEGTDISVQQQVLSEFSQVGLTISPVPIELKKIAIKKFELVLLVHKNSPLATKGFAVTDDLAGQSLILFNNEFMIHNLVVEQCRSRGFEPLIQYAISEAVMAHKLCSQGKGVAITVDFLAKEINVSNIVTLPFRDAFCTWDTVWVTKKDSYCTKSVELFENYIRRNLTS